MRRSVPAVLLAALALAAAGAEHARADTPDTNVWRTLGRAAIARAEANGASAPRKAKNVILFVGDGMGPSTVTAARIFDGQRRGHTGEENALAFESFPHVGLAKTYSVNAQVPESAATMTALVTGVKTREDVIALDERAVPGDHTSVEKTRVRTLLEEAEARGLATGVVTTTRITHATPAACYAHVPQRDWEDDSMLPDAAREAGFPDIARQLVEFPVGDGLDVAFGGGRAQFLPLGMRDPERPDQQGNRRDGRNLIEAWRARFPNGRYVTTRSEFATLDPAQEGPVLGLFEPSHMRFEADRGSDVAGEPSLSEMTAKAIELLARDRDGFFLMVEGGRIDHAHHLGNAYRALLETVELSNAVRTAQSMVRGDETLIVVTADHSHVFTIAGYPTRGNDILGLVVPNDAQGQRAAEPLKDMLGLPFTTLGYANGPGYTGASPEQREGPKRHPHLPTGYRGITRGRPDLRKTDVTHPDYLQEATVPGRNDTHAGEDVAVYAMGPGASFVQGVQEQSYVYYVMRRAFGWGDERK